MRPCVTTRPYHICHRMAYTHLYPYSYFEFICNYISIFTVHVYKHVNICVKKEYIYIYLQIRHECAHKHMLPMPSTNTHAYSSKLTYIYCIYTYHCTSLCNKHTILYHPSLQRWAETFTHSFNTAVTRSKWKPGTSIVVTEKPDKTQQANRNKHGHYFLFFFTKILLAV